MADEPKFPSRQLGRVGFFDTNNFTKEGVEQVEISSGLLCGGNNAVFVARLVNSSKLNFAIRKIIGSDRAVTYEI